MFEICSEEVWYYVSLLRYNHTLITPLSQLLCRSASIHHPSISHQSVIHPFIHLSSSVYHHSIIHQFPMTAQSQLPQSEGGVSFWTSQQLIKERKVKSFEYPMNY